MCFRNDENTSRAFCKLSKKCQFSTAWVPLTILLGGNKIYSARPAAFYRNLRYLVVYAIHSTIYYGFYMLIATVQFILKIYVFQIFLERNYYLIKCLHARNYFFDFTAYYTTFANLIHVVLHQTLKKNFLSNRNFMTCLKIFL